MTIQTTEIAVAALALSKGATLDDLNRTPTGSVVFILSTDTNLQSIAEAYWNKEPDAEVDAQTFYTNFKMLKGMLYQKSMSS